MNNGAFGENFPYSNFHDLNMDWIIKIAKDFLDQYTHIQEVIASGEESLTNLTSEGLEQLQEKADALEELLDQWYETHSNDIANALAQAIADFRTEAQAIGAEVIASIPVDYTALNASLDAFYLLNHTEQVIYNYNTKTLTIPGRTFAVYRGTPVIMANDTVLDLTSILQSGACNLWMKSNGTIFAYNFANKPADTDALYLGSVYYEYVHINGIAEDQIKLINTNGVTGSIFPNNMGSFIGIETEVRQIVVDITSKTITLPGGFKVYRGVTSAYSQEVISYTNATANKIWMRNDFTVYTTDWNTTTPQNPDDDCIGFRYGYTVKIAGVPDYDIKITNDDGQVIIGSGLTFGDAFIGIHELQEVTYNYTTKVLTIPQGFWLYRGVAQTRQTTTLDLTNYLLNEACIIFITQNGTIYARKWSSRLFENATDCVLGYVYGKVVILNGIDKKRISVFDSNSTVYCFGDSIPAGTNTTKNFLQFLHEFNRDLIFKNYCVGSTGYVTEATGTVIAGNGSTNNGTSTTVSGNNNVLKMINTVASNPIKNIIISAGTNDWYTNVPLADFTTAVHDALSRAKDFTMNIFVLMPIKRQNWANTNTLGLTLQDYADVIKQQCINEGVVFFDGYDVFLNPNLGTARTAFIPDGLHPNVNGHWRIANAINETVKQAMANPNA